MYACAALLAAVRAGGGGAAERLVHALTADAGFLGEPTAVWAEIAAAPDGAAAVSWLLQLMAFHFAPSRYEYAKAASASWATVPAGRTILLAEPVRVRLSAYLTHRQQRWPHTANEYFFITSRTALSTQPVSPPWLYRQYPASSHLLRGDRILDEAQATGEGAARMICELFGQSFHAATRYTAVSMSTRSGVLA
ncbi:hypothetical protein [Streptomyces sp. SYSU K217416]